MFKLTYSLIYAIVLFWGTYLFRQNKQLLPSTISVLTDSLSNASAWPNDAIDVRNFTSADLTPSTACLAVAATGEVFVGIDQIGSLGKTPQKGYILKLVDNNNDGKVDVHTKFAMVDNPRGIISLGDKLYVLHTVFSKETGIASGMDLVVFEDKDKDGVADGPSSPLIEHISSKKFLQSRGTDHSTNGIRMGIDGWIYIAAGDFGFHDATDRTGKKITMLGGGIVRVRPDGTEMEVFTHGTRNIYDVAIDPYMNIFTRDNTNDGGGWNIRFSHHIQSGEYGYPLLFKHFTEEILPALVDVGGGSGTGSLFMDEPTWPAKYNQVPMMSDWGNSVLYIHRVSPDGASYTQKDESFIKLKQITDLDVDGSGRLYLAAWDGAGYSGSPSIGFVVKAVPKGWTYKAFPDVKTLTNGQLMDLLASNSAVARLNAQQELLTRKKEDVTQIAWELASNQQAPLYARSAAIFTFAQASDEKGILKLLTLINENGVKELVIKALSDRLTKNKLVPIQPFIVALNDPSPRVRVAATIALGRLGKKEAIAALLKVKVPSSFIAPPKDKEGPHATPNSAIIPAHVAVRALVRLKAVKECVQAIGGPNSTIALWALRYMHQPEAVSGLMNAYTKSANNSLKKQLLSNLARIYKKETPYEGEWWWSTKPNGHGPYYKTTNWEGSKSIKTFILKEYAKASEVDKSYFIDLNEKNQMRLTELGTIEEDLYSEEPKIDLANIRNKKGQIGNSSIEDIMLAMAEMKGKTNLGRSIFEKQGCIVCHSLKSGETLKGPYMGQIGGIMSREQIAESILKPNASISQGFATVLITTKNKKEYMGFVTAESADRIILRDITGQISSIRTADIRSRKEMETSMMPDGLTNELSYEEFASLITFLSERKK
jgi:putative heme-binding domain-containing protein